MDTLTGALIGVGPRLQMVPPKPPHTYLGVAYAMYSGVTALAAIPQPPALPLAFLAAHTLECALKAYLSPHVGEKVLQRDSETRHNLAKLWGLAVENGLDIQRPAPHWVICLSAAHYKGDDDKSGDKKYTLRYSTGVHAIMVPGVEPMVEDIGKLLEQVAKQLQETPTRE